MIQNNLTKVQNALMGLNNSSTEACQLVLVSKKVDIDKIKEAYDLGVRDFGESRIQELLRKKSELPSDIRWHMIGHVQTNKVKDLVGQTFLIHSIDSVRLAQEIQKIAEKVDVTVSVLLQVNVSGEETKYGFKPSEVESDLGRILELDRIRVKGLMTMAPHSDDLSIIRNCFKELRCLREELQAQYHKLELKELSMGMSHDYSIAVEEGATMVRLGTVIFGERVY